MYVNSSNTGASSNRHNPGFILSERGAGEDHGRIWGFNLVYSGSHYGAVERSAQDTVRVMLGINPSCFDWTLKSGESFETPEAVMSYAEGGFNGLRRNFHSFVNGNIFRGSWKGMKWLFYIYYPAHLVGVGLLRLALHGDISILF